MCSITIHSFTFYTILHWHLFSLLIIHVSILLLDEFLPNFVYLLQNFAEQPHLKIKLTRGVT